MHEFTIGNAWSECVDFFQRNLVSLLVLVGGATLVGQVIVIFAFGVNDAAIQGMVEQLQANPEKGLAAMGGVWASLMVSGYLQAVGQTAALRVGLSSEKDPTAAVTYGLGATVMQILFYVVLTMVIFFPLMLLVVVIAGVLGLAGSGTSAVASMGLVMLLMILMLPLALLLSARLSVLIPIMVEARSYNPFAAAKISWQLTREAQWTLVGALLLYFVALVVAVMVLGLLTGIITLIAGATIGGFVSSTLSGAVTGIAAAVFSAGVYRALKPHRPGDVFA